MHSCAPGNGNVVSSLKILPFNQSMQLSYEIDINIVTIIFLIWQMKKLNLQLISVRSRTSPKLLLHMKHCVFNHEDAYILLMWDSLAVINDQGAE